LSAHFAGDNEREVGENLHLEDDANGHLLSSGLKTDSTAELYAHGFDA
jgi:hypothetical protein